MKVGREVRDVRAGGSSHTLDRPEEAADYAYERILEKRVRLREKTAIENALFEIAPFTERAEKSARLSGDEAAEKSIARSYQGGRFGESECLRFHSYPDSSSSELGHRARIVDFLLLRTRAVPGTEGCARTA